MDSDLQEVLAQQAILLRKTSAELAAVAYLFRLKRMDEAPPLNMEEINWGLSLTFERLARRTLRVARKIERTTLTK